MNRIMNQQKSNKTKYPLKDFLKFVLGSYLKPTVYWCIHIFLKTIGWVLRINMFVTVVGVWDPMLPPSMQQWPAWHVHIRGLPSKCPALEQNSEHWDNNRDAQWQLIRKVIKAEDSAHLGQLPKYPSWSGSWTLNPPPSLFRAPK